MRALIFSLLPIATLCAQEPFGNPTMFSRQPNIRTFLYGDFFFGSVRQDGLAFAIRSNDGQVLHGKFLELPDRWKPGFRLGFGSHLGHDAWEVSGDWTYFRSNIVQTAHAPAASAGSTYLVPLYIDASSYTQLLTGKSLQEAKENWTLSFNSLCFGLCRTYYLSKELGIRPQAGVFAAWIDQDVDISYRSDAAPPGFGNNVVQCNTYIENDTWKVGPFLGTKLDWYILRKFRIFGGAQTAILYRRLNFQETQVSIGNSNGDFRTVLPESSRRLQPWLNCQLGVAWNSFIHHSRNFFEIALQYEGQYFWHEFESRMLYEQVAGSQNRNLNNFGDLSLQGVALRFRLDF
jgi:hypothetical protein